MIVMTPERKKALSKYKAAVRRQNFHDGRAAHLFPKLDNWLEFKSAPENADGERSSPALTARYISHWNMFHNYR